METAALKKAVIEIVVIVLGVLIALFAESAWNDFQDRKAGSDYAARLSTELTKNLEHLEADFLWARQACSSAESALAKLRSKDVEPDPADMLRLMISTAIFPAPEYQRATYDDLIGTGSLSLIDDVVVREKTVAGYTEFFEYITAWRPPKDTLIRDAVLQTLPSEFILQVLRECIVEADEVLFTPAIRACNTVPSSEAPGVWFDKILNHSNIEAALSERAWQVCDFERTMGVIREELEVLIPALEAIAE
ncbi:MAG TPA: hypothetical protein VJ984_08050 [Xanthomonadales bacterium]|nr:hypothetical protein [Xanthomonadales bacterium]